MPDYDHESVTAKAIDGQSTGWRVILGAVVIVALAAGWFLMSWQIMGSAVPDALGEALGVALGLLVATSAVGAVVSARGKSDK
jgi:hypothetical protein